MNPSSPLEPRPFRPFQNRQVRRYLLPAVALLLTGAAAATAYQATRPSPPPASMAALLPQGALLTIESPDLAALLKDWNSSPEQKSWLGSDNYNLFSNSRLFSRLSDARSQFESAATAPTPRTSASTASRPRPPAPVIPVALDSDFLTAIAGGQSVFAWYDVGKLEALYITHLPSGQSGRIALLKDRRGWTSRQSAGITFYLRHNTSAGPAAQAEDAASSAQGQARTVAFAIVPDPATRSDLLVLATREDLLANALVLIHDQKGDSVSTEPWFVDASAALPEQTAPSLHMVLNLDRIVPLPYFRSYWVQRNVTEMVQYRAAVADLYREPHQFREERALLLKSQADSEASSADADLASLAARVPTEGVFVASAAPTPDDALDALKEKLLGRPTAAPASTTEAPDASLEAPKAGTSTDFDTRIDTPPPPTESTSDAELTDTLKAASLDAMLTYSSAGAPSTPGGLWIPIHSAVLLRGKSAWNPRTISSALQQSLRGSLTAAALGIDFRPETVSGATVYTLTGPKPLLFAIDGNVCLLADDRALLLAILQARPAGTSVLRADQIRADQIAAFNHTAQRAPFARLVSLVDGTNTTSTASPATPQTPAAPPFFSGSMRSLSDSFAALQSERFTERHESPTLIRQTVLYQWQ